jgi:hypothetical protein
MNSWDAEYINMYMQISFRCRDTRTAGVCVHVDNVACSCARVRLTWRTKACYRKRGTNEETRSPRECVTPTQRLTIFEAAPHFSYCAFCLAASLEVDQQRAVCKHGVHLGSAIDAVHACSSTALQVCALFIIIVGVSFRSLVCTVMPSVECVNRL